MQVGPKYNHLYTFKGEAEEESTNRRKCEHGEQRYLKMLTLKIAVMSPQAKEWQQLPEAGRGQEWILPQSLQRKCAPPGTLISAQ